MHVTVTAGHGRLVSPFLERRVAMRPSIPPKEYVGHCIMIISNMFLTFMLCDLESLVRRHALVESVHS